MRAAGLGCSLHIMLTSVHTQKYIIYSPIAYMELCTYILYIFSHSSTQSPANILLNFIAFCRARRIRFFGGIFYMPCCVAVESRAGFPLINTIFFWYIINMCILLCGLPLPNRNICSLLERWLKFVIAAPCYDFRHLPFLLLNARYQRKGVLGGGGVGARELQQGQRPSSKAEEGWRRCCFFVINSTPLPNPPFVPHIHTIFVFEAIHFYSTP